MLICQSSLIGSQIQPRYAEGDDYGEYDYEYYDEYSDEESEEESYM